MPLIQKKSKKAFEHNMKAEMESGKPQKQALAIAYSVKRKPKKMAEGGHIDTQNERPDTGWGKIIFKAEGGAVSAKDEKRPIPSSKYNDSVMEAHNSAKKALIESDWTDQPTIKQAQSRPKLESVKRPRMVPTNAFSTRLYDEEADLQKSAKVNNGPQEQPPEHDDEQRPDRQGPSVSDMAEEHSNHRKPYAEGGMINNEVSMHDAEEDEVEHPAHLEEDDDQMRLPVDEYMAGHFAKGGMIDDMDVPEDEYEEEHHDSIAAAIMAKKARKMAEGGQVDLDENAEEQPNSYYHQNEVAALKENYDEDMDHMHQPTDSNEHGDVLEDEDEHDMISHIRSKMNMKRQFR